MVTTVNTLEYQALEKQYNELLAAFYDFKELNETEVSPELAQKIDAVKNSNISHYSDLEEKYA